MASVYINVRGNDSTTLLIFIFLLISTINSKICDDDSDICKNRVEHISCLYQREKCGNEEWPEYENAFQNNMLHKFNQFRDLWVSGYGLPGKKFPTASAMYALEWSLELESFAWHACLNCMLQGDDCRDTETGPVAQLVYSKNYSSGSSSPDDFEIFQSWTIDAYLLENRHISKYDSEAMQLISPLLLYSDLTHIGCSTVTVSFSSAWKSKIVICNLSPAGPVPGKPIYDAGKPCNCPGSYKCVGKGEFPLLCHSAHHSQDNLSRVIACSSRLLPSLSVVYANLYIAYQILK